MRSHWLLMLHRPMHPTSEYFPFEVRPELRGQIHEPVVRHVGPEMHQHGVAIPARSRIIDIGKRAAGRTSQHIVEVERVAARILANHYAPADRISEPVPQRESLAFA